MNEEKNFLYFFMNMENKKKIDNMVYIILIIWNEKKEKRKIKKGLKGKINIMYDFKICPCSLKFTIY